MKLRLIPAVLLAAPFFSLALPALRVSAGMQAPQPGPTDEVVLRLVAKAPSGASTRPRPGLRAGRRLPVPDLDNKGWVVELTWSEQGLERTAVAMIAPVAMNPGGKWVAREGDWGLAKVDESATWAKVLAARKEAEISVNEFAATLDLRTFSSSAVVFVSSMGGFPPSVQCLVQPTSCVPGSQESPLLDENWLKPERSGYRFTFQPGPLAPSKDRGKERFVKGFALTAAPLSFGESGRRAFCMDETGRICVAEGRTLPVRGGKCPNPCQELK